MRSFLLLLLICAFIFSSKANSDAVALRESCMKDVGINEQTFAEAKKSEEKKAELEEKLKCFEACYLKGIGIMAEDGTINEDKVLQMIAKEQDNVKMEAERKAVKACIETKGYTDCETAAAFMKCMESQKRDA